MLYAEGQRVAAGCALDEGPGLLWGAAARGAEVGAGGVQTSYEHHSAAQIPGPSQHTGTITTTVRIG